MLTRPKTAQDRASTTTMRRMGTNARLREATLRQERSEYRSQRLKESGRLAIRLGIPVGAMALGVLAVFGLWHLSVVRGWQALRTVEVSGFSRLAPSEIATLSGLRRGQPLAQLDLHSARQSLLAHPWIAKASLSRQWLHGIHVHLVEQEPVGRRADGLWVAASGQILPPRTAVEVLPLLVGEIRKADPALLALAQIRRLEPALWSRLDVVELDPSGNLSLRLRNVPTTFLLAASDWSRGWHRVQALEKELGDLMERFSVVDLRFGDFAALRRFQGGA